MRSKAGLILCLVIALPVAARGQELVAVAKRVSVASLDSTLPAVSFERWLADTRGVPVSAITWEINDCGEGGDGREAPTCVEAILHLSADTTAHASLVVTGIDGARAKPAIWDLSAGGGSSFTGFMTLREWAAYIRAHSVRPFHRHYRSGQTVPGVTGVGSMEAHRDHTGRKVLLGVMTAAAPGQESSRKPVVAVTAGLGNSLGGLGAGVEGYLFHSRVSLGGGFGYWPEGGLCSRGTFSGAAAVRGFTGGRRHRGFAEASYSLVQVACTVATGELDRHYGPGLLLGYRYIGSDGFTFSVGAGVGDASGEGNGTEPLVLLGVGYTWRR